MEQDASRGGNFEAGDHAEAGGLAGTRGSQHGEELAVGDLEVDIVDGHDRVKALLTFLEGDGLFLMAVMCGRRVYGAWPLGV